MNLKINKEQEKIDMCQAVKDLIKDAVKEEKEKNKAAMKRIKELEKMVKNLQAQLKTA